MKCLKKSQEILNILKQSKWDCVNDIEINDNGKLVVKQHKALELCIYLNVALDGYDCDLNFIDTSQVKHFLFTFETNIVTKRSRDEVSKLVLNLGVDTRIDPLDINLEYFNGYFNEWSFKAALSLKEMFKGDFRRHDLVFDCEKLQEIENLFDEGDSFLKRGFNKKVIFKHSLPNLESIYRAFSGARNIEYIQLDLTQSNKLFYGNHAFSGIKNQHNVLKGVKFPCYENLVKTYGEDRVCIFLINKLLDLDEIELKNLEKDNPSLLKFLQDMGVKGKNELWKYPTEKEYCLKAIDFYIDERYFSEESVAYGLERKGGIFFDNFNNYVLKDVLLDESEENKVRKNLLIKMINTKYFNKHCSSILRELREDCKENLINLNIDILNESEKDVKKEANAFNGIRV